MNECVTANKFTPYCKYKNCTIGFFECDDMVELVYMEQKDNFIVRHELYYVIDLHIKGNRPYLMKETEWYDIKEDKIVVLDLYTKLSVDDYIEYKTNKTIYIISKNSYLPDIERDKTRRDKLTVIANDYLCKRIKQDVKKYIGDLVCAYVESVKNGESK